MWYLLFKLKINRIINGVTSILFALAPYHFYRYMVHISLSNYYAIPLVILLVFIYTNIIEIEKREKILTSVICGILIGLSNPHYIFFGLILYALSYLYKAMKEQKILVPLKQCIIYIPSVIIFALCSLLFSFDFTSFLSLVFSLFVFSLLIFKYYFSDSYNQRCSIRETNSSKAYITTILCK